MRVALIPLSASASKAETAALLERAGLEVTDFSWDMPMEALDAASAYILLADSPDLLDPAPLAPFLQAQSAQGKAILGLGYAAAYLVQQGLVPGLYKHLVGLETRQKTTPQAALLRLSVDYQYNAFTRLLSLKEAWSWTLKADLQFVIPVGLLSEIQSQGLDVLWFCDAAGQPLAGEDRVAALANKAGNVMAMLAYPNELAAEAIYNSLREHISSGFVENVEVLCYWPRK